MVGTMETVLLIGVRTNQVKKGQCPRFSRLRGRRTKKLQPAQHSTKWQWGNVEKIVGPLAYISAAGMPSPSFDHLGKGIPWVGLADVCTDP